MKVVTDNIDHYGQEWWDRKYTRFADPHTFSPIEAYRAAGRIVGRGSVVDLGCGEGWFSCHAAGDYFGVDWSAIAIHRAQRQFSWRRFECRDFLDVSGQFDFACAFELFEHLERPDELIRAMLLLAPVALISIPNGDCGRMEDGNRHKEHSEHVRYHYATYTPDDITELFPESAFIPIDDDHILFQLERDDETQPAIL